jgi:hypothetical protein
VKRLSPTTGRICAVSDMLPDSLTEEQVKKNIPDDFIRVGQRLSASSFVFGLPMRSG